MSQKLLFIETECFHTKDLIKHIHLIRKQTYTSECPFHVCVW